MGWTSLGRGVQCLVGQMPGGRLKVWGPNIWWPGAVGRLVCLSKGADGMPVPLDRLFHSSHIRARRLQRDKLHAGVLLLRK